MMLCPNGPQHLIFNGSGACKRQQALEGGKDIWVIRFWSRSVAKQVTLHEFPIIFDSDCAVRLHIQMIPNNDSGLAIGMDLEKTRVHIKVRDLRDATRACAASLTHNSTKRFTQWLLVVLQGCYREIRVWPLRGK